MTITNQSCREDFGENMENGVMIKKLEIYLCYSWPFTSVGSTAMNLTGIKTSQKKIFQKFPKSSTWIFCTPGTIYTALTLYQRCFQKIYGRICLSSCVSCIGRRILYHWRHLGSPYMQILHILYKGLENPRIWITSQGEQQYGNPPPVLRGDCILISHREAIFI